MDSFIQLDALETISSAIWLLLAIICLWFPLQEIVGIAHSRTALEANLPDIRLHQYNEAMVPLWMLTGAIALVWALEGRNWADLGFRFDGTTEQWVAMGVAGAIGAAFLVQLIMMHLSDTRREAYAQDAQGAGAAFKFMPRTGAEYRRFLGLGVTAGITEEIIFRGFMIWVLGTFMPMWIAGIVALVVFVVLHFYQGVRQLPMVTIAGAVLTALYVGSGSIYPAIIAHILVDVINGSVWWTAMKDRKSG